MPLDEAKIAKVAKLTEAQRRCVRMVWIGSSKRIAPLLGISHNTVNLHITAAMKCLGVHSRDEARALVAAWDERHSQELASGSAAIARSSAHGMLDPSYSPNASGGQDADVRDASIAYSANVPDGTTLGATKGEGNASSPPKLHVLSRIVGLTLAMVIVLSAAEPIGRGFEALARLILQLRGDDPGAPPSG